jgi:formylglycine-generating enzyme required for sulfatase activity
VKRVALIVVLLAGCSRQHATVEAALGSREGCALYGGVPAQWLGDARAGMIHVAGGDFDFGSARGYAEEGPAQRMHVDGLWIDRTEVTNAQFGAFVRATGYVTQAEHEGGAAVFVAPNPDEAMEPGSWWQLAKGASWRYPEGRSNPAAHDNEPVVDVSYADAVTYAHWLQRELPTEAQWEFAAKAGRSNEEADRAVRDAQGRPQANFWQGVFPLANAGDDGFALRAPVGCYAANPAGLYDMVGNVWEWTRDAYRDRGAHASLADPMPSRRASAEHYVIKGGSYLCSLNYCARARTSSRQGAEADLPQSHVGFRTVLVE